MNPDRNRTGQDYYIEDPFCDASVLEYLKSGPKVPLYPNQWNTWAIEIAGDETRDPSELLDEAIEFWMGARGAALPGITKGFADQWKIYGFDDWSALTKRNEMVSAWDLKGAPRVRDPKAKFRIVQFVYRGTAETLPWPAYTSRLSEFYESWCPEEPDLALVRVFAPIPGEAVPKPPTGGVLGEYMRDIPGVAPLVKTLKTGLYIGLAALGVTLAVSFRDRFPKRG